MNKIDLTRKSANFVGQRSPNMISNGYPEGTSNMYDPTKSMNMLPITTNNN